MLPGLKLVRVLNLGAGVQSTTLYMLAAEGRIEPFDVAIIADTKDETARTYRHVEWLGTQAGYLDSCTGRAGPSARSISRTRSNWGSRWSAGEAAGFSL